MPVNLCYTQKVRGFQQKEVKYSSKSTEIHLKRPKHQCPHCGATAVTIEPIRIRRIRGEPLGSCRKVILEFTIHRLYCNSCHHRGVEHIPFLSACFCQGKNKLPPSFKLRWIGLIAENVQHKNRYCPASSASQITPRHPSHAPFARAKKIYAWHSLRSAIRSFSEGWWKW